MAEKTTFDLIKKQNGEAFAKAIRAYDNGIFDIPNIVDVVRYAGREAEPIMEYLVSLKNIAIEESEETRDPFELLSEAGYDAYYADTLEKQNAIAPYFRYKERLCTFSDETRYQRYHIINAVRKDVSQIRREDFRYPEREDRYGTSVISIQILKNGGFISIKNRYNHTVENPDNTFSSDPDKIIKGLSFSLKRHFNVDFSSALAKIPEGYICHDNRIFKYHAESFNTYIGNDFFLKDGVVTPLNKDYQIICDDVILDLKEGKFSSPMIDKEVLPVLNKEIEGKKLSVKISPDTKTKSVYMNDELFMKVKSDGSKILLLNLPTTTILPNYAFETNYIKFLIVPKLKEVGQGALSGGFEHILAPKGVIVNGNLKLSHKGLKKLPNLSEFIIKGNFWCDGNELTSLEGAPKHVERDFDCSNNHLTSLDYAPQNVGGSYDCSNNYLTSLEGVPAEIKGEFDCSHNFLVNLKYAPQKVGQGFRCSYNQLTSLEGGPVEVNSSYDCSNNNLTTLDYAPHCVGDNFWCQNNNLHSLGNSLKIVGGNFWCRNNQLTNLESSLEIIGGNFFGTDNNWVSVDKPITIGGIFDYGHVSKTPPVPKAHKENAKKGSRKQHER